MQVGDILPLYLQTPDYNNSVYVQATLRDQNNDVILGSPVNLSLLANGYYVNNSLFFPAGTQYVTAQYLVYSDSGHTELSGSEGAWAQTFKLSDSIPNFPPGNVVGIENAEGCENGPIQDTIVIGSDHTLSLRLVDNDGNPFDLTEASNIQFRFLNADGSVLALNLTDMSAPIRVVSAPAGTLICIITAAQSALLATNIPAPFSIVIVQSSGTTIVNISDQLAIEDANV